MKKLLFLAIVMPMISCTHNSKRGIATVNSENYFQYVLSTELDELKNFEKVLRSNEVECYQQYKVVWTSILGRLSAIKEERFEGPETLRKLSSSISEQHKNIFDNSFNDISRHIHKRMNHEKIHGVTRIAGFDFMRYCDEE